MIRRMVLVMRILLMLWHRASAGWETDSWWGGIKSVVAAICWGWLQCAVPLMETLSRGVGTLAALIVCWLVVQDPEWRQAIGFYFLLRLIVQPFRHTWTSVLLWCLHWTTAAAMKDLSLLAKSWLSLYLLLFSIHGSNIEHLGFYW